MKRLLLSLLLVLFVAGAVIAGAAGAGLTSAAAPSEPAAETGGSDNVEMIGHIGAAVQAVAVVANGDDVASGLKSTILNTAGTARTNGRRTVGRAVCFVEAL